MAFIHFIDFCSWGHVLLA